MRLHRVAPFLLLSTAACAVSTPPADIMTAGRDEPVQPARPAPPPAPTPLPSPTPPPVPQRAAFTYQGELEQGGWLRGRAPSEIVSATLGDTDLSLDDDGYFWFVGRSDDVINTAGHLVGPFEVESARSEEHTSELQSRSDLVCRLLLEKKND